MTTILAVDATIFLYTLGFRTRFATADTNVRLNRLRQRCCEPLELLAQEFPKLLTRIFLGPGARALTAGLRKFV